MEHTWKEAPLLRQPPLVIRAGEKKNEAGGTGLSISLSPSSITLSSSLTHSNMLSHSHTHTQDHLCPLFIISVGEEKRKQCPCKQATRIFALRRLFYSSHPLPHFPPICSTGIIPHQCKCNITNGRRGTRQATMPSYLVKRSWGT